MKTASLEFFLNDGDVVMSTRFYPKTEERVVVLEPQEGTVRMTDGVFYENRRHLHLSLADLRMALWSSLCQSHIVSFSGLCFWGKGKHIMGNLLKAFSNPFYRTVLA